MNLNFTADDLLKLKDAGVISLKELREMLGLPAEKAE